jgi:tetratricopeptide (TPR) repeat protein
MVRRKIIVAIGLVAILALVSSAQTNERREGGPPPAVVQAQPQPPVGPGVIPLMRMKEYAEQLRARAREAQDLADRLRRQADELDQRAKQQMDRGRGPQQMGQMGQMPRLLAEIKEAIGRAEREGRRQEADELRSRAEQLMGRGQPMPSGPRMEGRQEIKKQIERLRNEAQQAKEQGRVDDAKRIWQEAERLDQQLRDQGPRGKGESGGQMPPEIQDIRKAAEQAEREGRMDDARRMREKAETIARQWEEQRGRQSNEPQGPRMNEPQEIKGKIGGLRDEAQKAKEQGRLEDANRFGKDADRLEQQMREQGPREKGESGRQMPPEVQEILKSAEQAAREGRMDDARRQREKAEIVARQIQEQKRQGPEQPGRQLKDEIMRSMEELKKEIGRLWQAVNEMRNRPKEGRPM